MNVLASVLLITALSISTPTLVLKTGKRISVDGPVKVENAIVLFRSNGTLYSVPSEEVDFDATRAGAQPITVTPGDETTKLKAGPVKREKLLRELEQNHTGTPASKEQTSIPETPKKTSALSGDESSWRSGARNRAEDVRRAKEDLDLLWSRIEELRSQINGFLSQGYKPRQFSYQTTQLANAEEQIPRAELEVRRALRVQAEFLEDARRQGVMPGWLR